jgi:hypothetical protein
MQPVFDLGSEFAPLIGRGAVIVLLHFQKSNFILAFPVVSYRLRKWYSLFSSAMGNGFLDLQASKCLPTYFIMTFLAAQYLHHPLHAHVRHAMNAK